MDFMEKTDKIYVAGHTGMVGSSITRLLSQEGYKNLITRTHLELDLLNQSLVQSFFASQKPEIVIIAAARVGGIQANIASPADFLYENLVIQNNLIHSSFESKAKRVLFLGSSCIYPRECPQPIIEESLLTGPLEPTNEGYALAKIAGLKLCEYYHSQYGLDTAALMPCNLYGPNDSFDLQKSHVLSALVKRFSDAVTQNSSEITLWGTGLAKRELMHVDDLARAVLFFLCRSEFTGFINIGTGVDLSIKELAEKIASKVNFKGQIKWDISKPDGMPRKCLDVTRMKTAGFIPTISIDDGIDIMIKEYQKFRNKT
jgi:GDP-L-fucose synthase